MMKLIFSLTLLFSLSAVVTSTEDKIIVRARLESCPGCQLNRLADVKKFVYEDIPKYENVVFKKIQGAPPELLFLNEADEVVERHLLGKLNRQQCNDLLKSRGFEPRKDKEL